MLFHQEGDDNSGRSANSRVAMHQDATSAGKCIVDEVVAGREMLFQISCWGIQLTDPLVRILLGELRVEASSHGEDVRDAVAAQDVLVV